MPDLPHPCLPSPWPETGADAAPIVWALAGTDSGGGAGLAADLRAAGALDVHLCPLVAAVTAQHSCGVEAVFPLPADQVSAQLAALAEDMPPRVIKTGLLASVGAVQALVQALDRLRERAPVALVVDPVLGASAGGAAFADEALLNAYRQQLLPRTTLLTPNRAESARLLGPAASGLDVPAQAAALKQLGAAALCITGGDERQAAGTQDLALDWVDASAAGRPVQGWLALPRLPSPHHHGSGCSFASAAAAALARGFVTPDALVLAKMLSWRAVHDGFAAGRGAGPVRATAAAFADPAAMPVMSFGDELQGPQLQATLARWQRVLRQAVAGEFRPGLYAISAQPEELLALCDSPDFAHLQLRIKTDAGADEATLRAAIRCLLAACKHRPIQPWINDHWQLALDEGARALHLGQEDWAALDAAQRQRLLSDDIQLGLSSHSLWELARARGLAPSYIACGPLWPTTTKDMPWRPQGLHNLDWWVRMTGRPVVAIGGLTEAERIAAVARSGAAAACLVRGLAAGQREPLVEAWRRHRPARAT